MLSWVVLNFILVVYSNATQLTYSLKGLLAMGRRVIWIWSVRPSVQKFSWNWLFSFFRELNLVLGPMWCFVWQSQTFWKNVLPKNGENKPSPEFFECIGKFSFFSKFFIFLSVWSIIKVCITVILVCLKNFIFGKILVTEIWPKVLLANRIAGFLN